MNPNNMNGSSLSLQPSLSMAALKRLQLPQLSHTHLHYSIPATTHSRARTPINASLIRLVGLSLRKEDLHIGRNCQYRLYWVVSCLSSRGAVGCGRFCFPAGSNSYLKRQASRTKITALAIPPAGSAAIAVVVLIGAAILALTMSKKEGTQGFQLQKKECEICKGSGICSSCAGEGFLLKNLSPEAAAKARASAKDAATRYTAGLPNKWRYCTSCSGSRNCLACEGRGWLA